MHVCSLCKSSVLLFWRGAARPSGIKQFKFENLRALHHTFQCMFVVTELPLFPWARSAVDSIQTGVLTGLTQDFTRPWFPSALLTPGYVHGMVATRRVSAKGYTACNPHKLHQGKQCYTNLGFPPVVLIIGFRFFVGTTDTSRRT